MELFNQLFRGEWVFGMMQDEENMLAYKLDGREGGMEDGEVEVGDFAYQNDQVLTQVAVCVRSLRGRAA
jgi:hypothetical protein